MKKYVMPREVFMTTDEIPDIIDVNGLEHPIEDMVMYERGSAESIIAYYRNKPYVEIMIHPEEMDRYFFTDEELEKYSIKK